MEHIELLDKRDNNNYNCSHNIFYIKKSKNMIGNTNPIQHKKQPRFLKLFFPEVINIPVIAIKIIAKPNI